MEMRAPDIESTTANPHSARRLLFKAKAVPNAADAKPQPTHAGGSGTRYARQLGRWGKSVSANSQLSGTARKMFIQWATPGANTLTSTVGTAAANTSVMIGIASAFMPIPAKVTR